MRIFIRILELHQRNEQSMFPMANARLHLALEVDADQRSESELEKEKPTNAPSGRSHFRLNDQLY